MLSCQSVLAIGAAALDFDLVAGGRKLLPAG